MIIDSTLGRKNTERRTFCVFIPASSASARKKAMRLLSTTFQKVKKRVNPITPISNFRSTHLSARRAFIRPRPNISFAASRTSKALVVERRLSAMNAVTAPSRPAVSPARPAPFTDPRNASTASGATLFSVSTSGMSQTLSSRARAS